MNTFGTDDGFIHPAQGVFVQAAERRAVATAAERRGNDFVHRVLLASVLGDALVTLGALCGAFGLRFHTPLRTLGTFTADMPWQDYVGHVIFESLLLVLILHHLKLYTSNQTLRWRKVCATLTAAGALWLGVNIVLTSLLGFNTLISRLYLLTGFFCVTTALLAWRFAFDQYLRSPAVAARVRRRILCVGWSEEAARLAQQIAGDGRHPYQIVGAVPSVTGDFAVEPPAEVRHLGDYSGLRRLLENHAVDMMVVCDPDPSRVELVSLANLCEKELVDFKVIPSCFQILLSGLHLETVSGVPVLGISRLPLDGAFQAVLKRIMDIVGGVFGLLVGAPLIAVFGALVWSESPGPIFYRQRRSGLNGREFFILKIRSMKLNAESPGARPGWTQKDDPRRLRVGAFMRRWNIDEIPQFLNVLRGEMSLVGPRPERPEFIMDFKEEIPHYNARHTVKPGITGWAQVNGLRGDTDLTERVKCDLYYMENWSPLLDLQIMLMTFWKRKNAC